MHCDVAQEQSKDGNDTASADVDSDNSRGLVTHFILWKLDPYRPSDAVGIKYNKDGTFSKRWLQAQKLLEKYMKQIYKTDKVYWREQFDPVKNLTQEQLYIKCCDDCFEKKFEKTSSKYNHTIELGGPFITNVSKDEKRNKKLQEEKQRLNLQKKGQLEPEHSSDDDQRYDSGNKY
jgi:hypothetical protein